MILSALFVVYLSTPILMKSIPAPSPLIQQAPQSIDFLKKYGYLTGTSGGTLEALYTKEAVEDAIKQAQHFGGIKETGNLNEETIKLFNSKRCGLPDVIKNVTSSAESSALDDDVGHSNIHHHHHSPHYHHHHHHRLNRRKKRFVLNGNSWRTSHLQYYINNWSQSLSQSEVVRELERTLNIWGKYGHLTFSRTMDPSEAEITVGFYRGHHGDMNPFDGRGSVLAHAFFPNSRDGRGLAGDVHFDDDETWSVGAADSPFRDTVDFTSVALHELGHSLGLHHSPVQGSVMNPYYGGNSKLGDDDVQAMYELYVKRGTNDYDEASRRGEEDEARRRYDEERRQWEERRREVEKKRWEEEQRKKLVFEREEKRRKYEEEQRKRYEEEERKKYEQEERKKILVEEEQRRRQVEEDRKRYEQKERKKIEEEQKRRQVEEERKRYEQEERRRVEEERRKAIQKEVETKSDEDDKSVMPPKSGYPNGTTFEGDDESVESHKHHDSTHKIPPTQSPHDHSAESGHSESSDGCNGGFSAATYLRGELFILKENMLWRLSRPGAVHDKYPVELHRFFHLLPDEVKTIDAMYQRDQDSSLVIFSGRKYWVFDGFKVSGPHLLQDYGLPQDVQRVDAVTSRNGQVLIFSGNRYWGQNDTTLESPLQRQLPRPISALRGLPDRLDAALTYNDVTYFFKDDRFWHTDRKSDEAVLHESPASDYWIGC